MKLISDNHVYSSNGRKLNFTWLSDVAFEENEIYDYLNGEYLNQLDSYENVLVTNYLWNVTEDNNATIDEVVKSVKTTMIEGMVGLLNLYLDKLINDYDLNNNHRLGLINEDGRTYLNKNKKKYDAILNDAFIGESPAITLTTIEATKKIYKSLTENGLYLTNIISSLDGENSKFLKAVVNTLRQVFQNVYVVPCFDYVSYESVQNQMVIATDDTLILENNVEIDIDEDTIILTDNYAPIELLVSKK